jgi:hypothetical protein
MSVNELRACGTSVNELRTPASEVKEEPRDDGGRSRLTPATLPSPKPLALLSSCLCSFSSRCFSLLLLSAMRSLNDFILGVPTVPVVFDRARPLVRDWPGRLRLTSDALRPLSMPSSTLAGLLGSSALGRGRMGDTGTCTSASGLGSSGLRRSAAVPGRDGMARLSGSALRAFCSCLSFSRASMACNFSCSVSSSSSSVVSPSYWTCCCSDSGRRLAGEGDTDWRARRSSYRLRPDGELSRAS